MYSHVITVITVLLSGLFFITLCFMYLNKVMELLHILHPGKKMHGVDVEAEQRLNVRGDL